MSNGILYYRCLIKHGSADADSVRWRDGAPGRWHQTGVLRYWQSSTHVQVFNRTTLKHGCVIYRRVEIWSYCKLLLASSKLINEDIHCTTTFVQLVWWPCHIPLGFVPIMPGQMFRKTFQMAQMNALLKYELEEIQFASLKVQNSFLIVVMVWLIFGVLVPLQIS